MNSEPTEYVYPSIGSPKQGVPYLAYREDEDGLVDQHEGRS